MRGDRILMSLPAMWSVLLCLHLGPAEDLAVACFVRQRPFFQMEGSGARAAARSGAADGCRSAVTGWAACAVGSPGTSTSQFVLTKSRTISSCRPQQVQVRWSRSVLYCQEWVVVRAPVMAEKNDFDAEKNPMMPTRS